MLCGCAAHLLGAEGLSAADAVSPRFQNNVKRGTGAEDSERQAADAALADGDGSATHDPDQEALRATLERLRECSTAERADDLAVSFCFIQTKGALVQHVGPQNRMPGPRRGRAAASCARQCHVRETVL